MKRKLRKRLLAMLLSCGMVFTTAVPAFAEAEEATPMENAVQVEESQEVSEEEAAEEESEEVLEPAATGETLTINPETDLYELKKDGKVDTSFTGIKATEDDVYVYLKKGVQDLTYDSTKSGFVTAAIENYWIDGAYISGTVKAFVKNGMVNYDGYQSYELLKVKSDYYLCYSGILLDTASSAYNGLWEANGDSALYSKYGYNYVALIKNGKLDAKAKGAYVYESGEAAYLSAGIGVLGEKGATGIYKAKYVAKNGKTATVYAKFAEGRLDTEATGFYKIDKKTYYYFEDGLAVLADCMYGSTEHKVRTGIVVNDTPGVPGYQRMVYVNKGKLDLTKTELVPNAMEPDNGILYYVEKGIFNKDFNSEEHGLAKLAKTYGNNKTCYIDVYVPYYEDEDEEKKGTYTNSFPTVAGIYSVGDDDVYLLKGGIALNSNYVSYITKAEGSVQGNIQKIKSDSVMQNYSIRTKLLNGLWDEEAQGGYGTLINGELEAYCVKDGLLRGDYLYTGLAKTTVLELVVNPKTGKSSIVKNKMICYFTNGVLDRSKNGIAKMASDGKFYLVRNGVVASVDTKDGQYKKVTGVYYISSSSQLIDGISVRPAEAPASGVDFGLYFKNGQFTKLTGTAPVLNPDLNPDLSLVYVTAKTKLMVKCTKGIAPMP